ncbi:hypothetical protein MPSEU_000516800 [Mayamaea pseudoterrestris]|nr:hypothetical protein MPSEU_000516800 [Mayamaea pseudoterrestris]
MSDKEAQQIAVGDDYTAWLGRFVAVERRGRCITLNETNMESFHNKDNDDISRETSAHRKAHESEHMGSRQYLRDMILGVNDGLVGTFLLVAGVSGGGMTSRAILLTALAGAIAGAISMCAGEYIATKSQNEIMTGEIALEKEHISLYLEDELSEMGTLLTSIGIGTDAVEIRKQLLEYYRYKPASLLKAMTSLEFGVIDQETRSPLRAGLMSCGLFLLGSVPSVLPFAFGNEALVQLIASAVVTTVCLVIVGAVKTWATRGNCISAAVENFVIAGLGGSFAYAVGFGFNHMLS